MIIDGKKEAAILKESVKKEINLIHSKVNKAPGLAVILIGAFAPSQIYVKNKEKHTKTRPNSRQNCKQDVGLQCQTS